MSNVRDLTEGVNLLAMCALYLKMPMQQTYKYVYMKRLLLLPLLVLALMPARLSAQYYQIANQLPSLISPALSGSLNYRGFVELSGLAGVGHNRANDISISTSQGFQYASWFYMGVGVGVDVMMAQQPDGWQPNPGYDYMYHEGSKTKVMIPVFSDFRFNIGPKETTSFFIDVKLGASWLIGRSYLRMADGCLSNGTQFLLRPSIGLRLPVSKQNPKQAVNIGLTYQLLTSNNNYYWNSNSLTIHNLGITVGFEW